MWVLDHHRDLMADFRAFYRLSWREAMRLPGPEFFALAFRTPCYGGAMAVQVARTAPPEPASPSAPVHGLPAGARIVPGTREAIMADPVLSPHFEFD